MADSTPPTPGQRGKIPAKMKRLIWIGVAMACLVLFEIGDLIMHIAHPVR